MYAIGRNPYFVKVCDFAALIACYAGLRGRVRLRADVGHTALYISPLTKKIMLEGNSYDLLANLSKRVELVLRQYGTLAIKNGDYWMHGIDLTVPSVDVLVFQTINLNPDLVSECAGLLDEYPEDFRLRLIEGGKDGKPLVPLGGLKLNRYGGEPI